MNKQFKMKGAAAAILLAASMFANHANATGCGPSTPTNYGGCDGTGVNFVKSGNDKVTNVQSQLDLKLSYNDSERSVNFTFRNTGNLTSSIIGIYFDDVAVNNGLFSSRTIGTNTYNAFSITGYPGSGVNFAMDTVNKSLPNVGSVYKFDYAADTLTRRDTTFDEYDYQDGVNQDNGSRYGEFITFKGLLKSGNNLQSVINAINNGTFRVGINVATYRDRCAYDFTTYLSEVCAPPSAVPVPSAVWLFGTALVGFVGVANRRKV